eukprot:SAG22_NODE_840_length_6896_cov_3.900103_2_plen_557_part_00
MIAAAAAALLACLAHAGAATGAGGTAEQAEKCPTAGQLLTRGYDPLRWRLANESAGLCDTGVRPGAIMRQPPVLRRPEQRYTAKCAQVVGRGGGWCESCTAVSAFFWSPPAPARLPAPAVVAGGGGWCAWDRGCTGSPNTGDVHCPVWADCPAPRPSPLMVLDRAVRQAALAAVGLSNAGADMAGDPLTLADAGQVWEQQQLIGADGAAVRPPFDQHSLQPGHYMSTNVVSKITGRFEYACNDSSVCDLTDSGPLLVPTAAFKAAVEALPQPECGPGWDVWCKDPLSTDHCGCGAEWTFAQPAESNQSYAAFFETYGTHYQRTVGLGSAYTTLIYGRCAQCHRRNSSSCYSEFISKSTAGTDGPLCSAATGNCTGCTVLRTISAGEAAENPLVVEPRPLTDYIYLQGLPPPCYPSAANEQCHNGTALLPPRLNVSQGVQDVLRAMVNAKTAAALAAAEEERCAMSSPGSDEWDKCHATPSPPRPRRPAGGGGSGGGGGGLKAAAVGGIGVAVGVVVVLAAVVHRRRRAKGAAHLQIAEEVPEHTADVGALIEPLFH